MNGSFQAVFGEELGQGIEVIGFFDDIRIHKKDLAFGNGYIQCTGSEGGWQGEIKKRSRRVASGRTGIRGGSGCFWIFVWIMMKSQINTDWDFENLTFKYIKL